MRGFQPAKAKAAKPFANGGPVRGPGTGTSDEVQDEVPEGTYIMPADSTQAMGSDQLASMGARGFAPGAKKVPVQLSNGEYKLPPDQVHAIGVQVLEQMKNATHQPVARGFAPGLKHRKENGALLHEPEMPLGAQEDLEPRMFFANGGVVRGFMPRRRFEHGGLVEDENRPNSFGDAAAAAASPNVQQVATAPAPAPEPAAPAPIPAPTSAPAPTPTAAPEPAMFALTAGAGRGFVNPPMADPSPSAPSQTAPTSQGQRPSYGPIGDRTTLTNEQAAVMNPAGRITATRGANGAMEFSGGNVSGQVSYNDASGKALPGGGLGARGFSGFDVAPAGANVALGPNGSYAFSSGAQPRGFAPAAAVATSAPMGARSPVGMTVEQAQRERLIGERIGHDSAYDQRLTGAQPGSGPAARGFSPAGVTAAGSGFNTPGSGPVEPGSFTGGYSGVIGSLDNGNMGGRTPGQQRRDAEVSASSIMNDGGRFDLHKGVSPARQALQAMDAQALEGIKGQNDLAQTTMRESGATQRTGMEQQGANSRMVMQQAGETQRSRFQQALADARERRAAQHQYTQEDIARQRLQLESQRASLAGVPSGYRPKADGTMEAIPGGPADLKNNKEAIQQGKDAQDVLSLVAQARPLIGDSTGSYLGAGTDLVARAVGSSTKGADAGAQLKVLQGALISKMPKMSGPQSDKDVQLYREMAGQIGDTTIPTAQRLKALEEVGALHKKYAPADGAGQPQQAPDARMAELQRRAASNPALAQRLREMGY